MVVVVMVSVDDASSEDHDMQFDDVVCLDIGLQAQEEDAKFFDQYYIIYIWCALNTPLKHQQHSKVFEQNKMDGNGMGESQESFGYVQPGEK